MRDLVPICCEVCRRTFLCVTSRALLLAPLLVLLAACESSGTSTNSGTASKAVSTPKPSASAEPGISAFLAYAHGASFGTKDFATAVKRVMMETTPVPDSRIRLPCLFLIGASEAKELQRQAIELHARLVGAGVDCQLREFSEADGADTHCQVNNLRLAHLVVFDWLERVLGKPEAPRASDPRLLC